MIKLGIRGGDDDPGWPAYHPTVLIRRTHRGRDTERRRWHVTTGAVITVKGTWNYQKLEVAANECPPPPPQNLRREHDLAYTLTLHFWPPGKEENTFLVF